VSAHAVSARRETAASPRHERRPVEARLQGRRPLQAVVCITGMVRFYQRRLEASVRRAIRLDLYTADDPTPSQLAADMDDNLFTNILHNPRHVWHKFLPDKTDHTYNLRSRRYSLSLTVKTDCNNFLNTILAHTVWS